MDGPRTPAIEPTNGDPRSVANARLLDAAEFLRRTKVRAFCCPGRGMVVDLGGGTMEQWTAFWAALENALLLRPAPLKQPKPRERIEPFRWKKRRERL
jgi:hypothetical protein